MKNSYQPDRADRKVERTIRLVPRSQRERYAEKWQSDLARAHDAVERQHVARSAMSTARRLRLRDCGYTLRGAHRIVPMLLMCVGIVIIVPLLLIFSVDFFPVFSLAIALTLVTPVTPPRGSYWLMIVSIAGAVISFIYFFFAFRASFQAADNPESAPEWARWDVLAFMIFLIFVVLLFISTMWHFLRSRR